MRSRLCLLLTLAVLAGCGSKEEPATLGAAASLRNAIPELVETWGGELAVTYGASGTLRKQVEGGAPIDAVLFASAAPVDDLVAKGLLEPESRRRYATNSLVLIGPVGGPPITWKTLPSLPADEKLAVGEPGAVPAGRYAKQALEGLGTWEALSDRLVFGGDVAAVLAYARRGEVAAAAVYSTDASSVDDVVVLDRADWPGAPTPEVVGAMCLDGHDTARDFLAFVASAEGRTILAKYGFGPP